jgi:nitroreductase
LERQIREVTYGSEHLSDAPVWIVACMRSESPASRFEGASIYPAVQNMILACRALGLGTVLTTRHTGRGEEADAIFGLPEHVRSYAILPIGFPVAPFGPVRRGPLEDVVFEDTYGQPWSHFERSASGGLDGGRPNAFSARTR